MSFSLETMAFVAIGEFVTTKISERFKFLSSFSDAIHNIVCVLKDARYLLFGKTDSYVSDHETEAMEKRSRSASIDFCASKELKKYVSFYKQNPELVAAAPEYPIADVRDKRELNRIVRNGELYRRKYGVVYKSPFHTMIVDPIEDGNGDYYAYERLVPSVKNHGVVLFTVCKGKIVLIRQFRHAIRKEQLCCPRGFGENGMDMSENAEKELYEELHAKVAEVPVKLGEITADSGVLTTKAIVYLMKIDAYSYQKEEGIRDIIEVSPDEFRTMLSKGDIDDGYSLAAYSLYSAYVSSGKGFDHSKTA